MKEAESFGDLAVAAVGFARSDVRAGLGGRGRRLYEGGTNRRIDEPTKRGQDETRRAD